MNQGVRIAPSGSPRPVSVSLRFPRRECRGEPRAGVGPFAEGGGAGEAQRLGGLVDRQPGEEPEAGHVGRGGVLGGEAGQGGVDVQECVGVGDDHAIAFRRGRTAGHSRRAWRRACGGRDRPGCAAWRRPRHGGTRCGRRTPRRRAGGRLRAPAPWRRACARPARPPAWPRRAGGARRRPGGRNRRPAETRSWVLRFRLRGRGPGNFALSSFHIFASSGLFVASASSMSRSRASARRGLPCGGIFSARSFIPSYPARSKGSASSYFF